MHGQGAAGQAAGRMFVRYRGYIAMVMFTFVMITALGVLTPYISNTVFYDDVLTEGGRFYGEIGKMVLLDCRRAHRFAARLAGQRHYSAKVAAELVYDLKKNDLQRHQLSFRSPSFSNRQTGGLMTQVNNDATTIYWFFCDGFPPYFVTNALQIHRGAGGSSSLSPTGSLTLYTFITVPLFFPLCFKLAFAMFDKLHAKAIRAGARSTPSSPTCSTACAWSRASRARTRSASGSSAARSRPRRRTPTSACRAKHRVPRDDLPDAHRLGRRLGRRRLAGDAGDGRDELRHADGLHRLRQYDLRPLSSSLRTPSTGGPSA